MNSSKALSPQALYTRCDPEQFGFKTTEELASLEETLGQGRAVAAVQFGVGIEHEGYNLFCLGPTGIGKHSFIRQFLEEKAAQQPTPSDWCYVNNFEQAQKPRAIELPAGVASALQADIDRLIEELRSAIPAAFESDDYRARKQVIEDEVKERQGKAFEELRRKAQEKGIAVVRTPTGLVFAPLKDGEILSPEDFEKLPDDEHTRIENEIANLRQEVGSFMAQLPVVEREGREKLRGLNREVTNFAVGNLIDEIRRRYSSLPQVTAHLDAIEHDVIENVDEFLSPPESPIAAALGMQQSQAPKAGHATRRYRINALVPHTANHGAPVIYEDHPSYQNLVGQVEYIPQMGALVTDFNLIRPGALHRANGGYLILDAHKVMLQPYAWEGLKRALQSSRITMESLGQMLGLISTVSLEPEPIPLRLKVVLIGERLLFYLLSHYDPEFHDLFKVAVDFEEQMDRTTENNLLYARLIGTMARQDKLLTLSCGAVARVIEQSARIAGDAEKLSTHNRTLGDLLKEADYWARDSKRTHIEAADVEKAVEAQVYRTGRLRERLQEEIRRGTILIDTQGESVGQVNGLSIIQMGQFMFGHPSRITARARLGKGEVIDIEREVELGGPIHSKGVLILSNLLAARYASERPLSLSASIVFEQSYGGVEGDSASCAELYALLSALAEIPIKQCYAVTGSVNQHGKVQAIGGVNEKIEGFFDLCHVRGLTGDQGVLIPQSNVKHLMLRKDVVEAVAEGRFRIFAVNTVDEGIEILTGIPAGERDECGNFPEGTVNQRVEARLIMLAEKRKTFASQEGAGKDS
jgi:lon-related putative ATP-dependent protease